MKIGITYDLRQEYLARGYSQEETAEFDREDTIDAIATALVGLGHSADRIGSIRSLTERLADGDRWDLVFNIAEGIKGFGREAQVPALLDAYDILYTFSDPLVLSLSLHKGMTKHVLRDLGVPTPDFVVVEAAEDISRVSLSYPLFAKPVAEGTGKGIGEDCKIENHRQLTTVCTRLLSAYHQPVLVERYLPGREFTVGIVGTGSKARSIGVMEVVLCDNAEGHAYSYTNKAHYENRVEYRLVTDGVARRAEEVALDAWRGLGCRDAGRIDVRADESNNPQVIELNPLAGINPVHSDLCIIVRMTGMSYDHLIGSIVTSALERNHISNGDSSTLTAISEFLTRQEAHC